MRTHAVIPAAGRGTRMESDAGKKQFLPLAGKPVIVHTLNAFQDTPAVHRIVCAISSDDTPLFRGILADYNLIKVGQIVRGGERRQDSVHAAVLALEREAHPDDIVLVHDAVRPLVTGALIERVIEAAQRFGGAVAALPVSDSLKMVSPDGIIQKSVSRDGMWTMQTPQAFRLSILIAAYQKTIRSGFHGTDEAALVTHLGFPVHCVEGAADNIKITHPTDLVLAERLLLQRATTERGAREIPVP